MPLFWVFYTRPTRKPQSWICYATTNKNNKPSSKKTPLKKKLVEKNID